MPTPSRQEKIQEDLDELLRQSATLAKALLIRNGEFFPFGATIGTRGKLSLVTPVPDTDRPTTQDVIDSIRAEISSTRDSLRASSLTALAATESGADAVRIELEHAEGTSLVIALPYARGDFGSFTYGDLEARHSSPLVWADGVKPRRKATAKKAAPARKATPKASSPRSTPSSKAAPRSGARATGSPRRAPDSPKEKPRPHRSSRPAQKALHSQPALF